MQSSWAHRVLIGATRGRLDDGLLGEGTPQAWDALLSAASAHGMEGWLAWRLAAQTRTPPHIGRSLQASSARRASDHGRALEDLSRALDELRDANIESAALDGPSLTLRCYGDGALRPCPATDLLLPASAVERATDSLLTKGFRPTERTTTPAVSTLEGPANSVIRLRRHVVEPARARRALGMTSDELWSKAVPVDLDGLSCRVLPASEELARLCLRASVEGFELVRLMDICGLIAHESVDWDRTAALLHRWRVAGTGYLVLLLTHMWTAAPVPLDELESLSPDRVRRFLFTTTAGRADVAWGRRGKTLRRIAAASADSWPVRRLLLEAGPQGFPDDRRSPIPTRPGGLKWLGRGVAKDRLDAIGETATLRPVVLFSPSRSMGMSHYVQALAQAMQTSAEVTVLDGAKDQSLFRLWRRLIKLVRARDAAVLVTSPHPSVPLGLLLTGGRGGFVFHDPILDAPGRWMRPLHILYYRAVTKRLGVIVLHSAMFRSEVLDLHLKARDIVVVPHGLAPSQMSVDEPYDPSNPLVFVGRLHPYKGLGVLLDALEILRRRGVTPPVIIGGSGVTASVVPSRMTNVEVRPGELSDGSFRDLIAECSAVLLPYERANQSGVLATAFRAGRPVIASRVGSFPEYVDDAVNGLLVPPGDAEALAGAIERLHCEPELAQSLAEGAQRTGDQVLDPIRAGTAIARKVTRA
jgi:glycosyltransferase involved in cell wall biosynthesis